MITEVSSKAKERFCRDCNIALRLYHEPYFTSRLDLYDKVYGTIDKWKLFLNELFSYNCEQDYFEEYNRIKDRAIDDIKSTEAYQRFNNEDMNKYRITHMNMPGKDIFKEVNDGREFISIDIKKANFSSLSRYDKSIFNMCDTWEDFIGQYTDNRHIINSKYIRQVILGNCNPKRHITYEKFIMDKVLTLITNQLVDIKDIVFFSNDEIVIDVTDNTNLSITELDELINNNKDIFEVPSIRIVRFTLHKIHGTNGYYERNIDGSITLKGLDNYMLPFVLRKLNGEEVQESDKVFYHEGLLATFLEVPEISL